MCVTIERHSSICGHKASHTEACRKKKCRESFFGKFFTCGCSHSLSVTYYWEICHYCRRYWTSYGVCETDAVQRTLDYRAEHDYHGPLAPHSYSNRHSPGFIQEGELRTAEQLAQNAAARRLGKQLKGSVADRIDEATEYDASWMSDDVTRTSMEVPVMMRFPLGESTETVWADFYTGNPNLKEAREPSKHKGKGREVVEPDYLELGRLTRPRPCLVDSDGFELQHLRWPRLGRPIPQLPLLRPSGAPDLNKPLPRLPRRDSGLEFVHTGIRSQPPRFI